MNTMIQDHKHKIRPKTIQRTVIWKNKSGIIAFLQTNIEKVKCHNYLSFRE